MTAVDTVIAELRSFKSSQSAEPLVSTVDSMVAALQEIQTVTTTPALIGGRVITTTQVYTPTPGALVARIRFWGAGGGGGGAVAGAGTATLAKGASAASYSEHIYTCSNGPQTVTIGVAGNGGSVAGTNGQDGGASSFGAILAIPGGLQGAGDAAGGAGVGIVSGAASPANATGGNIQNIVGAPGGISLRSAAAAAPQYGNGALSYCQVGIMTTIGGSAGQNATGFGNGGPPGCSNSAVGRVGGNGAPALCIIEEYA